MDYTPSTPLAPALPANNTCETPVSFVQRDGLHYAGSHLLLDLWEAENLSDADGVRDALSQAVIASGATILHVHLHRFGGGGGVSGIIVLAESHISIHTWPERNFAAIDIFMCGGCDPYRAIPVLRRFFRPGRLLVSEHRRGLIP
jgi:S-adenosylmethionine decarboxylase